MPLTPQDVSTKVFGPTRFRRGYDETEVDAFLDLVEVELTRLTTDNDSLRDQLEQALAQRPASAAMAASAVPPAVAEVVPEPSREVVVPEASDVEIERVTRTLVLAQRTADQALREAREEAERARTLARSEAEAIVTKAQRDAEDKVGTAERVKAHLEGEVDSLRTFEREYRTRLRAYLQVQLQELESDTATGENQAVENEAVEGPQSVSLPGTDDHAGTEPTSVRLPSDIGTVNTSLFHPAPTLVGATNGAGAAGAAGGAGGAGGAGDTAPEPPQSE